MNEDSVQSPSKNLNSFFSANFLNIVFAALIVFVIIFSFSTLVTKPRFWTDEAVSIHIARSFLTHGILSPQITPDSFFEPTAFMQSTGYPVTIPLAGFFKVFGYGLYQARIYMLIWILITLFAVLFLAKKLFSKLEVGFCLLLIASFASFYGSGRTVVGEVPGFALLLAGFYLLLEKKKYFWTGIVWGLAVVAKPSVFGLIIPAIVLTFLFERVGFFKKTFALGLGMIPAGLLWIGLVVPNPLKPETWSGLANFYSNPFSSSISDNVANNLAGFFHSTTLIYFGLFFLLVFLARFFVVQSKIGTIYTFTIFYSLLAFAYYLRSPGWLRYILIAELLILFILPNVISTAVDYFRNRFPAVSRVKFPIAGVVLGILSAIQFTQMFTSAQIYAGDADLQASAYLTKNFPDKTIGVLNSLEVAALLNPTKVYLTFFNAGLPIVGENPLFRSPLPEVVVSDPNNNFAKEGSKILSGQYVSSASVGGYSIYTLK